MAFGYIYKIYNNINNKVYIGQTTKTVELRFAAHKKAATRNVERPIHLYLAMKKYGVENFFVEQIDSAETQEELNTKEEYWINFYDSITNGYNMMHGGTTANPMDAEKVKIKHSNTMHSKETRQKISEAMHKLRTTVGFSDEHKRKIKEAREKRKEERAKLGLNFYNHPENYATRSRAVYCVLNTNEKFEFKSILDAGKWWYDNYKPFGEIYSTSTYHRKIEASILGKEITFGNKNTKNYKIITNIKWYLVV